MSARAARVPHTHTPVCLRPFPPSLRPLRCLKRWLGKKRSQNLTEHERGGREGMQFDGHANTAYRAHAHARARAHTTDTRSAHTHAHAVHTNLDSNVVYRRARARAVAGRVVHKVRTRLCEMPSTSFLVFVKELSKSVENHGACAPMRAYHACVCPCRARPRCSTCAISSWSHGMVCGGAHFFFSFLSSSLLSPTSMHLCSIE